MLRRVSNSTATRILAVCVAVEYAFVLTAKRPLPFLFVAMLALSTFALAWVVVVERLERRREDKSRRG